MIKALIALVLVVLVAVTVGVTLIVLDARDREPVVPQRTSR
jgi:hypothetical protein